ncbi:MAG: ELWxxDGT repeat protein, partial [Cyanobium sp.]
MLAPNATLVGDINQATQGSNPRVFTSFGGCLYFINEAPGRPPQLWRGDPATGEVVLVQASTEGTLEVQELRVVGDRLYARGYTPLTGWSLYQVDSAPGSLLSPVEGTAGADPQWLTALGGQLYYSAYAYSASGNWLGRELVRLDPQTGLIESFDLHPGSNWGSPRSLTELNGRLFFLAYGAGSGEELWGFNPATEAGPQLLHDIWPGGTNSGIDNLTASGGKLYFTASDGSTDDELWVSDGTATGTIRVADINQTSYGSEPQPVVSSGGKLFFTAFTDANGWELHRLDPANGSLQKLEIRAGSSNSEAGGNGGGFADLNGTLYFSAYDDSNGWQLWRVHPNGSLEMLPLGVGASTPQGLTVAGGTLYFSASGSADRGINLSRSFSLDGEAAILSFDLLRLDSWDGESLQLYIDNQLIFSQPFVWYGNDGTRTGSSGAFSWSITATSPTQEMGGWAAFPDQIFRISVSIPAGRASIRLGVGSGLDQWAEDESYGIRNLEIRSAVDASTILLSDPGTDPSLWSGGISTSLPDLGTFLGRYGANSSPYLGRELWRIDNATGEPVPIDINPGGGSSPWGLFNVGGKLYFTAYSPGVGDELWTVDPADNVPHLVADVNPGEGGSRSWPYNSSVVAAGGRLYYVAEGPQGRELYMVAPGIAGAQLLDLNLGGGSSDPQSLTVVGERLFFRAYDGSRWDLYATSTETGVPTRLNIPNLTTNSYYIDSFTETGSRLYFRSWSYNDSGTIYRPLYSIDASTGEVSAINGVSTVEALANFNGTLYFSGYSNTLNSGYELFALAANDPSQTPKLLDLQPGPNGSSFSWLTAGSDALYTVAYGRPLEDLSRSFNVGNAAVTIAFDFLRLDTWDGEHFRLDINGQEVFSQPFYWSGNVETRTGSGNGFDWSITPISAVDYLGGNESYADQIFRISVSVPTGNNTIRLGLGSTLDENGDNENYGIRNLEIRSATDPSQILVSDAGDDANLWRGGRLASSTALGTFLSAEGGRSDWNLWRLDPTELNRTMRPLLPASMPNKSSIRNLFSVGGTLYFSHDDGVNGRELWQSDGTAAGTRLATDINGHTLPSYPRWLTDVNGKLYFTATIGINGFGLYGLDPATGVVQRLEVPGLTQGVAIDKLVNANGRLYFRSNGYNSSGNYLPLYTLNPETGVISQVPGFNYVDGLRYLNGQLFFTAYSASYQEGYELFRIADGSTQPQLIDVNPNGSSSAQELVQAGDVIYFTADRDGLGRELFRLDADFIAKPVRDIWPGGRGSNPRSLFAVGSSLYFVANDGFHDTELWQTDGTEAGTRLARDINNLSLDSSPGGLLDVNGILYFTATDGSLGRGLYRIDPTTGAPQRLTVPGLTGGNEASIDSLINANGRLYFRTNGYNDAYSYYRPLYTLDPETNTISQIGDVIQV